MNNKLKQIIKDELLKLPTERQDVINSFGWSEKAEEIGKKYILSESEINDLQTETFLVLVGLEDLESFARNIEDNIVTSKDEAGKIAEEIIEQIFTNIYEKIPDSLKDKILPSTTNPDIVENLDSRFDKLPANIQGVVEKSNYQSTLYAISTAHKLSVTQMGILDTITTDLIIGSIHPDEFKTMVTKKLGLPPEETTNLVNEINEQIFKKIRGQLMNLNQPNPIRTYDGSQGPSTSNGISTDDASVLKSHGIEVIPVRTDGGSLRPPTSNGAGPEKQLPQIEKLEIQAPASETHPIVAQKLSGSVQAPTVKTEYVATNKPEIPKTTKYAPGTDPYRIVPE